jgi:hypothetical protein
MRIGAHPRPKKKPLAACVVVRVDQLGRIHSCVFGIDFALA